MYLMYKHSEKNYIILLNVINMKRKHCDTVLKRNNRFNENKKN